MLVITKDRANNIKVMKKDFNYQQIVKVQIIVSNKNFNTHIE